MRTDREDCLQVEIRIEGHLDQQWSVWLGGLTLAHEADGTTALRGHLTDQAQLYGVLAQIRDLGADLISLTPLDAGHDTGHDTGARPSPDHSRRPR